MGLSKYFIN